MQDTEDILVVAAGWHGAGELVAIATVTETWGSSPRPVGSRMAMTSLGRIAGSVSGGCIEAEVVAAAKDVLRSGKPELLDFGVSNDTAWNIGLSCGGKVKVLVEAIGLTPKTLSALNKARAERRAIAYAKNLPNGAELLLPSPEAPALLNAAAHAVLAANKSCTQSIAGELWFIEARNPSPRLIIVGAVHIAQVLAPLAAMMGFEVALADPRQALTGKDRFPDTRILDAWPDTAMDELQPDSGTAVVVLTHDPKLDDPALDRALRSEAFYIGALGSRKSHAARLGRLACFGHDGEALARIRGPVGLRIAALTAPEIALSIMAEIVAVRRGGEVVKQVNI